MTCLRSQACHESLCCMIDEIIRHTMHANNCQHTEIPEWGLHEKHMNYLLSLL